MSASNVEVQRRQRAGHWVLLDARFHLLAIGRALYQGTSPRSSLDVTARRILLPRMRAACLDGLPHAQVQEDFGHRWSTAVRPILGPVSGQPLAVLGCYGPADAPLPKPPLVGGWEWQVTPPGPEQQLRSYWSPELFEVYGNAVPAGPGPHWREAVQWLDEVVESTHRTGIQRVLQTLRTATSDALIIHSYAARNSSGARVHLRMAGRRDVIAPGPDTWLRGVTMRLKSPGGTSSDSDKTPSYLDAAFALSRDALCAIDVLYEHVYLTSTHFADLGVALPAHRHLPEMCHPDDLPTLRAMLAQAAADTSVPAAAVRVRLAGVDGIWREVEMQGSGVQLTTEPPHHVLCRVTSVS
ncbi:hypothetical protein L3Q67_25740 [Saccharothrix sp. AJ9571]|nr:hypothetical protein L3Q67_25740 [Saccharothrix sp. AJ9571]